MLISRSLVLLVIVQVLLFTAVVDGWRRRRRRRRCYPRNCSVSSWSSWSTCTASCGSSGSKTRTRRITVYAYCGGSCYSTRQSSRCPGTCCPVNCAYSWTRWSSCSVTCRYGTRSRRTSVWRNPSCGGRSCPRSPVSQSCGNGRCCPVNCQVGSWRSWGSCNAACERSGQRTRTRGITTNVQCGGTACPSTTATKVCNGPCCRRNCVLSSWSAWTKCNSGSCAANSGTQSRSRRVITAASCSGTCSSLTESQRCTPTPVRCVVSSWGGWQACVATNGKCGGGTKKRVRRVLVQNYCSASCPVIQESTSCVHSCCPVNCQLNNWRSWSSCSSTCGQGTNTRQRTVAKLPSCGGQACGSLTQTKSCVQHNDADCIMGAWSTWSVCDNDCGQGRARKTRRIVKKEVCRGRKCGVTETFKICTDYRSNRNCVVGSWTSWGRCDQTCSVGTKWKTRRVTVSQRCRGNACPALKESTQCGSPKNGCQHKCTNGVCSCNSGYNLVNNKQCAAKDCGSLTLSYCAPGTRKGTTCLYATLSCPNKQTTFPVTCTIVCPSTYAVKGINSVSCTAAGTWSSTAGTYCRRINDPPTQILLSGPRSVSENLAANTLVGVLSSVDPNTRDSHSYSLMTGAEGKFIIKGNKLYTSVVLDYETMNRRYDLTVRSIDNGNPSFYVNKVITITLSDVNEHPTNIQLSNYHVNENSDADTVVGLLSTTDQDHGQLHSYIIKDTASGRFKIHGNTLKVALSNKRCLENGGTFCALNYENKRHFTIVVRSSDDGSPSLFIDVALDISLTNVNDQPRGLSLSNNRVKENAGKGHVIGEFSALDEDKGQVLKYSLSRNDQGRFKVFPNGTLYKANATDYEKKKTHLIMAIVEDNGSPRKTMKRTFVVEVLDVNEPPISIHLKDTNGQLSFSADHAHIKENTNLSTTIGTLEAADNDVSQKLNFTLDNAAGAFSSSQTSCATGLANSTICSARLLVSGGIDYEISRILEITVRVTDQHGSFKIQNFNISVDDVNERPSNVTISGSLQASVPENNAAALVGELVTSDEDHGQNHDYTLLRGSGVFKILGNKVYLNRSLDFEIKNNYVIMVTSTDTGTPPLTSSEQTFVINVMDENEAPTQMTLSHHIVSENSPRGTIIGNLTIEDPDNSGKYSSRQRHVCRLTDSAQGRFRIITRNGENSLAQAAASLDYEKYQAHNVSIVCSDPSGLVLETSFVVNVADENEPPTNVKLSVTSLSENSPPTTVGRLSTQDPDNANIRNKQTFKYFMSNTSVGPSPFIVDGDLLKVTRSLNYETARSWTVVVRAQDNGIPPLYRDETIVVDVIDKNDRPTAIQLSNVQVKENSGRGTIVGRLVTSDEDIGQNHTYQMIDSASGRFKVDGNSVMVALSNLQCLQNGGSSCALNYETQSSYNITVTTTDNGNPTTSFTQTFEIFLVDVNDQPRDLRLSNNQVKENSSSGAVIGSFSARDEDIRQTMTFSLTDDDGGRFGVNGRGELVTTNTVDYETVKRHVIRAQVRDNGYDAKKFEKNFTIEVLDINEAPIALRFTSIQAPNVLENATNGSIVGTLLAQDFDANQQLHFQLDDDSDGAFSLLQSSSQCQSFTNSTIKTSCTVKLVLTGPLNYEKANVHYIIVRATDNHGSFTVQRFSINVTDCNDAPADITLSGGRSAVVNENARGVFVGELGTNDEDSSQSWEYKLLVDTGGLFRVVGSRIYVSENTSLDYEKESVHIVRVRSMDDGEPPYWISRNFTIVVADLNEQPTNINLSRDATRENSSPGTVIARVTVEDPDNARSPRQQHSCAVIGGNRDKFSINNNNLVNSVLLDYERTPFINITIECTDDASQALKYHKQFTIIVVDENEAPVDVTLSSLNVRENLTPRVIATLSTIDPDNSMIVRQKFQYHLISCSSLQCPFAINGSELRTNRKLDHETKSSWNLTIRSNDTGNPSLGVERSFVITVQDVNEAPTNIHLTPSIVEENPDEDTLVGRLTTTDEDQGQSHRYTVLDGAGGRFKLVNNTDITIATPNTECLLHGGKHCRLNYEVNSIYSIRVRSTDDGSPPRDYVMDLNITLRDVNDAPRDLSLSNFLVKEHTNISTTVGFFLASDEDNQTLSYSLGRDPHGLFAVTKTGRLFVAKPTDHEKLSAVIITVNVTDNGTPPKWTEKQFTIIIQNINEAPVNTSLKSTRGQQKFPDDRATIDENSPLGTIIGTLVSLDPDAVQSLNFTLDDSSGGHFIVDTTSLCVNVSDIPGVKTSCSSTLYVNGALDYENTPQYSIIVRVTDPYGHFHVSGFTVSVLDRNDQPSNVTIQGLLLAQVDENKNDEMIGDLVTSDEDSSQSHSYTLKNSSNSRFTLKGSKLCTSHKANLDYEEERRFEIVVAATDDGTPPKTVEQRLTIQVNDVNERPTNITLSRLTINENSPEGTHVANITVSDPDNLGPSGAWQTHRCILLDSAQDRFKMSNNQLWVNRDGFNFERNTNHDIVIQCTDSAVRPLALRKSFTIDVIDVNERPVQISLSNNVIQENAGASFVGSIFTVDPDNEQSKRQTFTYALVVGDKKNTFFIQGNSLRTKRSLDYEKRNSWLLLIKTTDSQGLTFTQNFTIVVKDINDPPIDIFTSRPLTVSENSVPGSPIAVFSAKDEDAGQTHRFYISDVSAYGYGYNSFGKYISPFFSLDSSSGRLLVTTPIDFENVTQFTLVVVTKDNGYPSLSFNKTFVLEVLDVNEAPNAVTLDHWKIPENSVNGSVVGNLHVSDPDNVHGERQHYDCEVVNDVPFEVLQMKLVVSDRVLNFEDQKYYTVEVNCTEKGNATFKISRTFGIEVSDVNERPFNLSLSKISVKENQQIGTLVGDITAQDPDNDNLAFSFSDLTTNFTEFFIKGANLYTSTVFDYENQNRYPITLMAIDDGKPRLNIKREFNVTIVDCNDAPEKIYFYSSGVYENAKTRTIIGNFSTVDQDQDQSHVYSLLNHNDVFMISGNQLMVNQAEILDFEKQPLINISVLTMDVVSNNKSHKEILQVRILDANERPYDISTLNNTLSVNENTKGATEIIFDVHDPDRNQKHNCSLTKGMKFFDINNNMEKPTLQVRDDAVLDHESNASIKITLLCKDNGIPTGNFSKNFTISINDVNERPTNIWLNGSLSFTEAVQNGSTLGLLVCEDPDQNQTHSFRVLGKYSDTFKVLKNENILTVFSNKKLNYENLDSPNISIEIITHDDGSPSLSFVQTLNLTIENVNEAASEIRPAFVNLNETQLPGTNISELTCNNPEKWQSMEYTLLSHQDRFTIKTINHNVTYKKPILTKNGVKENTFQLTRSFLFLYSNLTYNYHPFDSDILFDILVSASDNGNPPMSYNGSVFINVTKVDPCSPDNDCDENANCTKVNGFQYSCSCNDGFTGDGFNCTNIDDCHSSQYCDNKTIHEKNETCFACYNNGTCFDETLNYTCSCQPGFSGKQCLHNIDECKLNDTNPCHNGSCIDGINNFTCDCYRGYNQSYCEENIDDCTHHPCGEYGQCLDGVDSYSCDCAEGYIGSRCDRLSEDCHQNPCLENQYCVPYLLNTIAHEEKSPDKEHVPNEDICFSGKHVTTVYLAKNLSTTLIRSNHSLTDVEGALKMSLEDWFLKNIQVLVVYLPKSATSEEKNFYNISDVSVVGDITENAHNISVSLIARVGDKAISQRGLICALVYHFIATKQCPSGYVSFTSKDFEYADYLCPTVNDSTRFNCIDPRDVQNAFQKGPRDSLLSPTLIYTLSAIGVVLFIAVIVFALYGNRTHKFNLQEAMRRGQQYNHVRLPEEDDEHYRDVMFRHHISTTMAQTGAVNPIYGFDEDDDDQKMIENPLYRGATYNETPPINGGGITNPLYGSVKREQGLRAKPVTKTHLLN